VLLSLSLIGAGCAGMPDDAGDDGQVEEAVVGGSFEPNYKFPWEVSLNGCHGVLIDPGWVLTAAHCVPMNGWSYRVSYSRTDPYDGSVHTGSSTVATTGRVFIHPDYKLGGGFLNPINDVALIHLDTPFVIDSYIQTVAVPSTPAVLGTTGAIAGGSHNGTPPAGYDAVMRTTIPSVNPSTCAPPARAFCISSPNASLCPGDSGSGFVTVENGRAVVRGIASFANVASCSSVSPDDYAAMTDVFSFHDWILSTMARSDATLAGNTRVHTAGRVARGVYGFGCTNPYGTMWGPMNVSGTEVGANCAPGDTEAVVCSLYPGQTDPIRPLPVIISSFTMKTTTSAGQVTTTKLPVSSATAATYYGVMPAGVTREFTCTIGLGSLSVGGGGGVLVAK
jgi:trypsin